MYTINVHCKVHTNPLSPKHDWVMAIWPTRSSESIYCSQKYSQFYIQYVSRPAQHSLKHSLKILKKCQGIPQEFLRISLGTLRNSPSSGNQHLLLHLKANNM